MSIVQYEGTGSAQTIGHGLGVTPAFVVVKNFDGSNVNWNMWHKSFTNSQYMRINLNNARLTETNCWGAGDVTSSVIGLGSHDENNESGETHIAYCFAEGDGWCSAGTYNGNALADGAFIYTGFRPAFIWIKNTETNHSHLIKDTETETGNFLTETGVFTNSTKGGPNDLDVALAVDIVSNGFKARYGGGTFNSANTFLFMAFAEYPFTHTNAR